MRLLLSSRLYKYTKDNWKSFPNMMQQYHRDLKKKLDGSCWAISYLKQKKCVVSKQQSRISVFHVYFIVYSWIYSYHFGTVRITSNSIHCIIVKSFTIHQTEAVTQMRSVKKVFLKISQNSQENTCARVYFSIKLQVFFLYRTSLVAAYDQNISWQWLKLFIEKI